MKLFRLNELEGHDVYEFSYANNYPNNWSADSLFLYTEDFSLISSYLDIVYAYYHYYGPQKVMKSEWEQIKQLYLGSENINPLIVQFFVDIDEWIKKDVASVDYFWILGV